MDVAAQFEVMSRQMPVGTEGIPDIIGQDIFDVYVTVRHWYNNINDKLDATVTIY